MAFSSGSGSATSRDITFINTDAVQSRGAGSSPGPLPRRQQGGWAGSNYSMKGKKHFEATELVDERLIVQNSEEESNIPMIPDIEDMQEEDLVAQLAAPPSMSVTRVATYKQLDTELKKQAGLFTLDGDIDLKLLANVLSPESDITEEDKAWDWDKLFAEVSPDIQEVWNNLSSKGEGLVAAASFGSSIASTKFSDTAMPLPSPSRPSSSTSEISKTSKKSIKDTL